MSINSQNTFPAETFLKKNFEGERFSQDGNPDLGIADKDRKKSSEALAIFLADTYLLYLKTQNYHWNVTGPNFLTLHTMFMAQYSDLALAVDLIAERIRALGQPAPGTFLEFSELSSIKEERGVQGAEQMLANLNSDQVVLIQSIQNLIAMLEKGHDYTTVDLLTQRLQVHEKNAWMLSSFLK